MHRPSKNTMPAPHFVIPLSVCLYLYSLPAELSGSVLEAVVLAATAGGRGWPRNVHLRQKTSKLGPQQTVLASVIESAICCLSVGGGAQGMLSTHCQASAHCRS